MLFGFEFGGRKRCKGGVTKGNDEWFGNNRFVIMSSASGMCFDGARAERNETLCTKIWYVYDFPLLYARPVIGYHFTRLFFVVHRGKGLSNRLPLV